MSAEDHQQQAEDQQLFSTFQSCDQFEEAWSSTISPDPVPVPYPAQPTTFSWPTQVSAYVKELFRHNFHLRPRQNNPYFFTNGTNGHLGRETYEVYGCRLPAHPDPAVTTAPDFNEVLKKFHEIRNPGTPYTEPKFANHPAFPTSKDSVVTLSWFHAGPLSCGPPGLAHGGLLSAIADTLMYEGVLESQRIAVTAGLDMKFKAPTPINSLVLVVSSVELVGERKAVARCALFNEDLSILHVEASAVFVTPAQWVGQQALTYGVNAKFEDYSKPAIPLSSSTTTPETAIVSAAAGDGTAPKPKKEQP